MSKANNPIDTTALHEEELHDIPVNNTEAALAENAETNLVTVVTGDVVTLHEPIMVVDCSTMSTAEVRERFDKEWTNHLDSFMRIAYLLWYIKTEQLFKEEEFGRWGTIEAFAENEYHIKKTQTYNYIKIWEKYGDKKRPMQCLRDYEGYSMTQLLVYAELDKDSKTKVNPTMSVRDMRRYLPIRNSSTKSKVVSSGASFQTQLEQADKEGVVWSEHKLTYEDLMTMLDDQVFVKESNLDINLYTFDIQARYVEPVTEQKAV